LLPSDVTVLSQTFKRQRNDESSDDSTTSDWRACGCCVHSWLISRYNKYTFRPLFHSILCF
jgi:hypothetical protein